jgi:UDP-glucuronate decarboxylase
VNLGNQGEFTILELANLVMELTDSKSRIVSKPLPVDDPTRRRPDTTLARTTLHWEPKTSLREGLEKTIAWFRTIRWDEYRAPTPNF